MADRSGKHPRDHACPVGSGCEARTTGRPSVVKPRTGPGHWWLVVSAWLMMASGAGTVAVEGAPGSTVQADPAAANPPGSLPMAPAWLPAETVAWVTIPDARQFRQTWNRLSLIRLWADPAMTPFREHFLRAWREAVLRPIEQRWAISWTELAEWLQGQWTLAWVDGSAVNGGPPGGVVMGLEVGDRREQVRTNLAALQQRWVAAGRSVRTEMVRGIPCLVLLLPGGGWTEAVSAALHDRAELPPAEPSSAAPSHSAKAQKPFELAMGLHGGVLWMCDDLSLLERILAGMDGSQVPSLKESGRLEPGDLDALRGSMVFGALFPDRLPGLAEREAGAAAREGDGFGWAHLLRAAGLSEAKLVTFRVVGSGAGLRCEVTLHVPQEKRQGLVRVLDFEPLDALPPAWVPAGVLRFYRVRLNGPQGWQRMEEFLAQLSPAWKRTWDFLVGTAQQAGRQQDPGFDVRREVVEKLGDDWVYWQVTPREQGWDGLEQAPSLLLVGSGHSEALAASLAKVLAGAALRSEAMTEREFLGRKLYSVVLPWAVRSADPSGAAPRLHFGASERYVGFAFEPGLLEDWLRSLDTSGASAAWQGGWREALAEIRGGRGCVGYEDYAAVLQHVLQAARADPENLHQALIPGPLGFRIHLHSDPERLRRWVDPQALPPWEAVARYVGFGLLSTERDADRIRWTFLMSAGGRAP